ncbi:PREDICTED: putative lysosomal acid lipase/cholesteryl ester hydrolase [Acanthisitta chloris]|uniref:putative lysosomal acid lipase/cholesteryl ester hydrolase n=1 Tax=Acanthisitta chloris TaxID=57068 RepID=UPI0004F0D1C6|nr:PREDICTED: putative lysosomal acid lipase/cholesteryl ester hydrolase [Acanthisitta chloris]
MMWLFLTIACLMCFTAKSYANPEVAMDVGEIVRYHGYPYEEHEVVTDDGYYLTVQRIPHSKDNPESISPSHEAEAQGSSMFCPPPKAAVLLQHGLVLEGSNWVTNLPNNSLGFILADAGYDVWIGNSRGNSWSRKHKELEFHQKFAACSFHEMAMYDLPATINYILQKTGQEQLYYVAYSQGTTTGFIAFSSIPELDRKIKMFFALAPITVNSNMKSPLVRVFDLPEVLVKLILGHSVVFDNTEVLKKVISSMCTYSIFRSLCSLVLYLPGGFTSSLNVSRIDVYLSRYPDSTSLQNMLHWRQLYQTGEFKHYDYGSENMLHYNQSTPPFYELENMKAPLAAWYGGKDWISAPEDVNLTLPRITNIAYRKYIPDFVHFDFLWGKQVYDQVYKEMLQLMEKST